MYGGDGIFEGIENFVCNCGNGMMLELFECFVGVEGSCFFMEDGYLINLGMSFFMVFEYLSEGLKVEVFLIYGQSGNLKDEYFWDQIEFFLKKQWWLILFEEVDVEVGIVLD